jgi:hypothetical protein
MPATSRRLVPADWEGFEPGDVVRVRPETYLGYRGFARIRALAESCDRPHAWIEELGGRSIGLCAIGTFSLQERWPREASAPLRLPAAASREWVTEDTGA